jgi:predicted esterase
MSRDATVKTIEARTQGQYLVSPPLTPGPAPLLVGFHGYGEHAERHLHALRRLPGAAQWLLVSIDALHRFYDFKRDAVVGSWMTRQNRDSAIADNLAYVGSVVDAVMRDWPTTGVLVYAGFSQGVAMAYRAAVRSGHSCAGVIALAGDVPPELWGEASIRWPRVLVARGHDDTWYTQAKMEADLTLFATTDASVESLVFAGGHEWTDEFEAAAGRFLATCVGPAGETP